MSVQLNHTIIWCGDKQLSANYMAEILGRPAPREFMHFLVVDMDNDVSLDFTEKDGKISLQHYAFLISEREFDEVFARLEKRKQTYWADPARAQVNQINHHFGGRGLYFADPNGHSLEVITKPYGSV